MIHCPTCKSSVDDAYLDERCPFCNEYIRSKEWLDKQADSFVRYIKLKGMYERIKVFVWSGEIDSAINEIRRVMGKPDEIAEPVIVSRILREKPANWSQADAPAPAPLPQELLNQPNTPRPNLTTCSACGHQVSVKAESCPSCGNPTGVHVCPKCQSINTKVISGASKAGSIFLWGVFAANKVVSKFECKDCGHKW